MRKLLLLGLTLVVAFPTASSAQVEFGARIGFAPALGTAMNDPATGQADKMSDAFRSQIPMQIEAAYKLSQEIAVGVYFSYGFGQNGTPLENDCSASGTSCATSDMRLGLQAFYFFTRMSRDLVPWVGAGVGYEWATIKQTGGGGPDVTGTLSGWEFLNLQVGGDFVFNSHLAFGPYVMLSIAQFSKVEAQVGSQSASQSISNKAIHEWLGLGVHGKFDL